MRHPGPSLQTNNLVFRQNGIKLSDKGNLPECSDIDISSTGDNKIKKILIEH